MKKWINGFLIMSSIILAKFLFTFIINEKIIKDYNEGKYDTSLVNTLYVLNFNEPYIAYYNHGNILYQTEQYEEAINHYKKALKKNPPKKRVCDIQINLSLSILATADKKDKTALADKLKEAREILYENHCADAYDDSGESEKAEQLEEEIKEQEKEIESSDKDSNEEEKDKKEEEKKQEKEKEKEIEEQLKENRKNANENRNENLSQYENSGSSFYYGKTW